MIVLSSAHIVLPDRLLSPGRLTIEGDRIAEIAAGSSPDAGARVDLHDHYLVPGFIDVHVHGVEGYDSLDGPGSIDAMATRLPRYGVTSFCPTTVACNPAKLSEMLSAVRLARTQPNAVAARVLPAHLESNFTNPEYRGAQPVASLRLPPTVDAGGRQETSDDSDYDGTDILAVIMGSAADVGIVTLAPELPGGIELTRRLAAAGHRVSLGHSGADYGRALEAISAGARHATHLFNRMPPIGHREPGLAGAALASEELAAEIICDGHHVHPAMIRMAIAAKHPSRVMAITDGTACSGLPAGARARLGGQSIVAASDARLDDGTLAGSILTMDKVFGVLVGMVGLTLTDAATVCSTTPARELGMDGCGVVAVGAIADLAVLDRHFRVVQTYIGGRLVFTTL